MYAIRSYYDWKYLKEEETEPKKVHNAWGQGVAVDYQSGYFADIIGFDATYYGAVKLGASDYFMGRVRQRLVFDSESCFCP